ncbi:histidine phosphatase family protein [Roseicyclus sp.]|uniref:histidine phosphatase family protein n=1 Tax=Roseicyclus sp. TaxID=1914329 RepID=UPI003F9F46D0
MPPALPPLFVLRHGETVWNREGRLQGQLDSALTPLGRAQAERQGAILARVVPEGAVAISSDSGRARVTAGIALAGTGIEARADPRLREIALGAWQGLTIAEVAAGWPDLTAGRTPEDWKFDAPGGEGLDALAARVGDVLAGLTGPTILVTHGVTSRVLRCLALGRPLSELGALPCGQGVVHLIENGGARLLEA